DIFDKGTDIKTADFSKRRMSPIEDFAVGIPSLLRRFTNANQPSFNKYIKRWTRNPFDAEADANIAQLQTEYKGDHPIGYPLFLEAQSDYSFDPSLSNNDTRSINETVFFVINTSTGDYIRVNMAQTDLTSETFRARVDIVPDSTNGGQVTGGYQVRRNAEGLANFGTDLASILGSIKRNAENEDAGTLSARKYEANWSAGQLGGSGFTFSNRATMPSSNGNIETFFAGETYRTIPAKVGDQIAIVSRSVLWREAGASNDAFSGALMFRVGASTPPPVWTGNVPQVRFPLQANGSPVPVEFRNNLFVSEDRVYPRNANDNSRPPGRDTIMAITARDTNLFYNPISIINPTRKSQLEYGWSVEAGSGLANWLKADTIVAADPVNPWWQARGYVRLKGQPSNPYVVPGGEWVTVTARNYPPNFRTLDSMKANGIADSIIAKYHYLYSSYFSNQAYDGTNARWLQQDTVNYGWNADTVYRFRIFVTDSLPIFQNNIWACANGRGDTLFANLTDKLRFKADYNTDDESEDSVAATLGWTFPYGRTAYAFMSKNTQGIDTTVDQLSIVRPIWMQNRYLKKYSDGAVNDPLAVDFTSKGQINIVIDSLEAINILSPLNRQHSALNTDTVITVVANDGHGGITNFTRTIRVNVAPTILNDQLADAFEDEDYNIDLSIISPDSNKRIRVSDPNFGDNHTYELIYGNDPRKTAGIDRDGCFTEAGKWNIENANTPNWLKINPRSGLLYGTPRVLDTKLVDTTVTVTVLVTDQGRLTHVKTLQLRIVGRNHDPEITSAPNVRCVESGQSFTDSVWVRDIDLRRTETVNVAVLSPSGLTVEPATINGNRSSDSVRVAVKGNPFTVNPYVTEVRVRLRVTDANGGRPDTLEYTIKVSEQSRFTSRLRVANKQGAFEDLFWGTGANATTGDDAQAGGIGKLDSNYCEYELPPVPPFDVFDARWGIPSRNGTLRNFFPNCQTGSNRLLAYKGRFQSGGVNGQTTNYYPVTMTWNKDSVPARNNTQLNPCGGTWFLRDGVGGNLYNINMNTGVARVSTTSNYEVAVNGSEVTLTIKTDAVQSFEIVWDQATPVEAEEPVAGERAMITGITPNPFSGTSNVSFSLPTSNTISMNVYDALGNKVATLINNTLYGAGTHTIEWNALNSNGMELPSGTYTVRLSSGAINVVQRAVIVR
ncbi:MAG: T9SS type A sorting domain-containing protein, partial [Candidatus Kapabacteria bacterium]|nr:T9SS type A sorting domain-containing protein [Candidatus Kapabacteria bacterium]